MTVDAATDVWSLGLIAFELLTGERVFGPQTTADEIRAAISGRTPMPWEDPERAPALLRKLRILRRTVMQCLSRDAAARPSAAEVLGAWNGLFESATASASAATRTPGLPDVPAAAAPAEEEASGPRSLRSLLTLRRGGGGSGRSHGSGSGRSATAIEAAPDISQSWRSLKRLWSTRPKGDTATDNSVDDAPKRVPPADMLVSVPEKAPVRAAGEVQHCGSRPLSVHGASTTDLSRSVDRMSLLARVETADRGSLSDAEPPPRLAPGDIVALLDAGARSSAAACPDLTTSGASTLASAPQAVASAPAGAVRHKPAVADTLSSPPLEVQPGGPPAGAVAAAVGQVPDKCGVIV